MSYIPVHTSVIVTLPDGSERPGRVWVTPDNEAVPGEYGIAWGDGDPFTWFAAPANVTVPVGGCCQI